MSGLVAAAMIAPVVLLLGALLLGRFLRSADRLEEARREPPAPAIATPVPAYRPGGIEDLWTSARGAGPV